LLNMGTIGARRRGVLSGAAGGGRGIKTTERRAIPKILVIGFAIPLMRRMKIRKAGTSRRKNMSHG
jgi:hypothetical protein